MYAEYVWNLMKKQSLDSRPGLLSPAAANGAEHGMNDPQGATENANKPVCAWMQEEIAHA